MPETSKSLQQKIAEKNAAIVRGEFGMYGYSAYEIGGERYICGITGARLIQLLKQLNDSQIVGYPIADWFQQNPLTEENDFKLNLMLAPTEAPPFSRQMVMTDGKKRTLQPHQVSLPSPLKPLQYDAIRQACGGNNGMMWGDYVARAYVAPKATTRLSGRSQVVARGSSESEALSNLESVLTLYDGKILDKRVSYSESDDKIKNKYRVYPAWIWIHKPSLTEKPNKLEKIKIMVFSKKEPESFKKQLEAIL